MIFAAMLAMASMNAMAADNAAAASESAVAVAADEGSEESAYRHPFADDENSTKHWTIASGGFYMGLGIKHSFDKINNSFEVGLLNVAAVNYNSLHGQNLSLGVGIHHRSYSMKRPNMLMRSNNSEVIVGEYPSTDVDVIKNRSSNLNVWALQVPLMFSQKIVKKLEITVAGIMNWNFLARADNHYEINKIEHDTRYKGLKQEKINFDFMGALSWNQFGIYCRYSPSKFFKEGYGPEIKNTWTLGVTLGL
jgi:hypothetical protein